MRSLPRVPTTVQSQTELSAFSCKCACEKFICGWGSVLYIVINNSVQRARGVVPGVRDNRKRRLLSGLPWPHTHTGGDPYQNP